MPFKLVVWDFDGTLADSLPSSVALFNRLAAEMGFRPVEDVAAARTLPTRQFLRQHGISFWRLPRLVRKFHAAAADGADRVKLFAGVPEVLAALAAPGPSVVGPGSPEGKRSGPDDRKATQGETKLGILSSNREDNIRRCLRANGAEGHFAFVIGYPRLFGKAKALRRILRAERLDRAEVLYVGDELRDVEAARKVGVKVAAVTWGFQAAELLRTGAPDFVVNEPGELLKVLDPGERAASAPRV